MLDKLFKNNNVLLYVKNTVWLLSEKFLGLGVALILSVWVARHLGPEKFGLLSFSQSFATLFVAFAALGLQRILERDLVDNETSRQAIISSSFALIILGACTSFSLMFLVVSLRDYDEITKQLILIVGLTAFLQVNIIYVSHFVSRVNARPYVISNLTALSISNLVKVAFILTDAPLHYFAFGFVLDGLLLLPILYTVTKGTNAQPRVSMVSFDMAKSLLRDSWPYILTGIFITLYVRIDTVMIKEMLGDYEVGQYSAAAKLSEGLYYFPLILVRSLYPAIVRAKKQGEGVYNRTWKNLYSLLFYTALAIAIVVSLLATHIITLLYGPEYAPAIPVLVIHVWASLFVFVSMGSGRWLLTENLQLLSIGTTFVGVCTNIGLNFFLIPRYGIEGAAVATIVSYGAAGYFAFALFKRTRPAFYLMSTSVLKLPSLKRS